MFVRQTGGELGGVFFAFRLIEAQRLGSAEDHDACGACGRPGRDFGAAEAESVEMPLLEATIGPPVVAVLVMHGEIAFAIWRGKQRHVGERPIVETCAGLGAYPNEGEAEQP